MSSYAETLIERYQGRGVLVDTNLLLLFAIGSYDQEIIRRGSFDRLSAYSFEDLELLRRLMALFPKLVTTSYVLTEVSNWIGYLPLQNERDCLAQFGIIFQHFEELIFDALEVSRHERFHFLGLTDTAIAIVANEHLVVSDDARLIAHLNGMGLEALNINHLRQEIWFST